MPKVSVVMGVYNGSKYLSCTLRSILEQTLHDIELIIVNDGSDQETNNIINQYAKKDNRIRVVNKSINEGLTKALIDGCNIAIGKYIARIDNGDIMVPEDRLEKQSYFLDNNQNHVLVSGRMLLVDLVSYRMFLTKVNLSICHATVMMRRLDYNKCGGYNSNMKTGQDTDLWPRLLKRGKKKMSNNIFVIATMRNDSISVKRNSEQYMRRIKEHANFLLYKKFSFSRLLLLLNCCIKITIPLRLRLYLMRKKNCNEIYNVSYTYKGIDDLWQWYVNKKSLFDNIIMNLK